MSPTKKKQNISKEKRDDSAPPKQANESSSVPQTSESTTPENTETDAMSERIRSVLVGDPEQLGINIAIQNHQDFSIEKYLIEARLAREEANKQFDEKTLQMSILKVQAEIKDAIKDLSNLSSIRNIIAEVVADATEKIETCDACINDLKQDHTTMINIISGKMKSIGQVHANINDLIEKTVEQQKFFDRESQLGEQTLDKLNTEIDLVSKGHEEIALSISEANKVINETTKTLGKLRKTNKRLKEHIDKKQREKDVNDEALAAMNANAEQWIKEKTETIQKLEEEEIELKNEQANLMAALNNAKEQYNKLCKEEDQLTLRTTEQDKVIARVKTANKNLGRDETVNAEFQEKFAQLSLELKKISNKNAEIQNSVEKKQQQWDNLKRVQVEIAKKQQDRNDHQAKLSGLKKQNTDSIAQMSVSRKNIDDIKARVNTKVTSDFEGAIKRIRMSSNPTTDEQEHFEIMSNSSSVNLQNMGESESEIELDFNGSTLNSIVQ